MQEVSLQIFLLVMSKFLFMSFWFCANICHLEYSPLLQISILQLWFSCVVLIVTDIHDNIFDRMRIYEPQNSIYVSEAVNQSGIRD